MRSEGQTGRRADGQAVGGSDGWTVAPSPFASRVDERIRGWNVIVEHTLETRSSFLAFGRRGNQPVVVKVLRAPSDEERSGEVLRAFDGMGLVRVYDLTSDALLLERLSPATALASVALAGRDDEATHVLADVMLRMAGAPASPGSAATVLEWAAGFDRYLASGDDRIPRELVERARRIYRELGASQRAPRLLHGDLHHYNVLFDADRGWLGIDPKGLVGEIEYEIGASLRNPYEHPEVFASTRAVERRLTIFASRLKLDVDRALRWAFAQAVLSAIWSTEDGDPVDAGMASLRLARVLDGCV